ncbi:hypothetical protein VTN00DRAFT_5516 [Thermoascus crustaceus]|uniref:uncharacterized protein n=1 Tax=Thermoascus crustaceus TaxID=5088 RepID=UPI0037428F1B
MASPSGSASVEDVMEDLELQHALLQSLMETRPHAVAEKEEIVHTIKRLERKLARLRGDPSAGNTAAGPSSSYSTASPTEMLPGLPQMDGSSDSGSPAIPRWGGSQQNSLPITQGSPFSRPQERISEQDSRFLQPFSTRKRPHHEADLGHMPGEFSEPPSKRATPTVPRSVTCTPSSASVHDSGEGPSRSSNTIDELQKLLGFDSRDTLLAMQNEQREAERWLAERREQERRDAEFARRLQEGWQEASRPGTASNSPAPSHSTLDSVSMPPPRSRDLDQAAVDRVLAPAPFQSPSSYRPNTGNSIMLPPPLPTSGQSTPQRPPSASQFDSSDSDIAEITSQDFQRRTQGPFTGPSSRFGSFQNTASSTAYPWADADFLNGGTNLFDPLSSKNRDTDFPGSSRSVPFSSYCTSQTGTGSSNNTWYGANVLQNTMATVNSGRGPWHAPGQLPSSLFPSSYSSPSFSQLHDDLFSTYSRSLGYTPDPEMDLLRDKYKDYYDFASDPKKTTEEIKQLLETIRPDTELAKARREGTPEALKYPLMEHQKLGLAWMKSMEESEQKGGILADDMGLGKTVQALALIVSRPSDDPARKTTLIIAPVALMQQWKREIERMLKPGKHQRSVYVLHGEKRGASFKELKKYDVVLTTFGTLASELKRKEDWDTRYRAYTNGTRNSAPEPAGLPVLGPGSKWYRVIVDEAQCIKNRNTKAAVACCIIDSKYRWCMSGTPMMNSVSELHSLLRFLRIRPYCELERFNSTFTRPLKSASPSQQEKAMQQLQVLLKAVLLRRTKTSKIDGRPILQLPPRITEKVHAVFSEDERQLYDALEARTQIQFNKYLQAGSVGRNYSNVLVLLLRLRQACCHPHLITDFSVNVNANTGEIDLIANAKQFSKEVVLRLKDNENLECPVCIDAVDNPIIFFPCGHSTCAECFARISDPSLAVRQGNDGSVEVKCPNCRAKLDPKKVTDNVSFRKVHFPEETGGVTEEAQENEDDGEDDDSDEDDDNGSLTDFIVPDDDDGEGPSTKPKSKKAKSKGKGPSKPKKSLAELKKDAQKNAKAKRKYLNRLEKTWVTSAKIEKAMEILQEIQDRNTGEKTIIFSQFTSLLDLLEVPIMRKGWGYKRYDGSMKPADRNHAVLEFTDKPNCKIMLVSLKAGNSGLNLVAASQVIIFDPFWNPYIEEQAIDRAHRIGQLREVHIHRILVEKTVEDRILDLQEKKRELIEGALDEKARKNVSRLGTQELAYLFGINN